MRTKQLFACLLLAILVVGCSKDQAAPEEINEPTDTNSSKQQVEEASGATDDTTEETAEEVKVDLLTEPFKTEDIEMLLQLEPGKYGEDKYDETKVKEEYYAFLSGVSSSDYFPGLLALAADDYRTMYTEFLEFDTSYGDPNTAPDTELPTVNGVPLSANVNVAILLDASGSMRAEIDGKSRMEHAKGAIQTFVSELSSDVNVSLLVYGHKGAGKDADKALSCASTEVVYDLSPYNQEQFDAALDVFSPSGWTPLAAAIAAAHNDLQANSGEDAQNIVYIVSDGVETCDGNPVDEAKKLNESDIKAIVNIIGFDVDTTGQNALEEIADAGKGTYMTVTSQKEMEQYLGAQKREHEKEWLKWQSENADEYQALEREKIHQLRVLVQDSLEKNDNEKERLLTLVDSMKEEIAPDEESKRKLKSDIGYRNFNIRMQIRQLERETLQEIRENGGEARKKVRERGAEERDKIKTSTNPK